MYVRSLKQPEYQHYREVFGAAKTFKHLEDGADEIKALLLVRESHVYKDY